MVLAQYSVTVKTKMLQQADRRRIEGTRLGVEFVQSPKAKQGIAKSIKGFRHTAFVPVGWEQIIAYLRTAVAWVIISGGQFPKQIFTIPRIDAPNQHGALRTYFFITVHKLLVYPVAGRAAGEALKIFLLLLTAQKNHLLERNLI